MKRIGVFLTYDAQKIVDRYIGYMLAELRPNVNFLVVVCNNKEVYRGKDILEKNVDKVFYRENQGFDAGGFKEALCDFLGWEKIHGYDELVLVNDSMFGPFRPMKDIFSEMGHKPADFWGLATHGATELSHLGALNAHLQSYFLVIRKRMLHCKQFQEYWERMPYYETFDDVIKYHEVKFSEYFSGLGYLFAALADTAENDSVYNYSQYAFISYELIKKRNFPFLKRKQLSINTLYWQTQENLRKSLDYIDRKTNYDINLIWENIIRVFNISDLQRSLHLQYILPSSFSESNKNSIGKQEIKSKIAILIFISNEESAEYVLEYLNRVKNVYQIEILAEENVYLNVYKENGYTCRVIEFSRKIDFLIQFSDIDYVCILHDTDVTSNNQPSCIGKSYLYNIWENLLKNDNYVLNILNLFYRESRLGLVVPPLPNFARYFGGYGKKWGENFDDISRVIQELRLHCQISPLKEPFRITDSLWIRGKILKKLEKIKANNRQYLPYLWIYLAQDSGYYSGIVESSEYASINEVNLQYYVNQISNQVRQQYGDFEGFDGLKEKIHLGSIWGFCKNYSRIYVYGIGEMARKYKPYLPAIEAYIVSNNETKPNDIDGISVFYLSEIELTEECGIILCLNKNNQRQVIPLLNEKGIKSYFCI